MYKFVILSALVAVCAGSALPLDTPEVAHAKAAHLAAVEQAKARNLGGPWAGTVPVPLPAWRSAPIPSVWNAPAAPVWNSWNALPAPVVVANGQVQDTPEVVAEKAKHFALVADAAARASISPDNSGLYDDGQYRHDPSGDFDGVPVWAGAPLGIAPVPWGVGSPVVVANGHVQDTPEVAAAKAAHLATVRAAGGAIW